MQRKRTHKLIPVWLALMLLASALTIRPALALEEPANDAQPAQAEPPRTMNGLALTPPMGWNSWNKFACNVDEKLVRRMADAMVSSGMRDVGYRYVVIDDCWHGERDRDGFIQADPKRFPSGMKALGDYIHAKGLKFGIYSDAGRKTCGGRPGSQGYEFQDALQYARWGVDYLKYDWCNTGTRNAQEAYTLMADALRASGRDIVFSLCEWGNQKPWLWGKTVGNLWRTTGDIYDKWQGRQKYMLGMLDIVDINEPLWPYAGPGHWNDPDMLEVGNGGMTETEYRTHFSLWAIMAAPLIAGNDLSRMDEATRSILLNREVIAVNQDALGAQGRRVAKDDDQEIWVKPLADGGRAVLLFNRSERSAEIGVEWEQLGYPRHLSAHLRDLWKQQDLSPQVGRYATMVEPHAVVMLVVRP
jgi:alpha-galactosidase